MFDIPTKTQHGRDAIKAIIKGLEGETEDFIKEVQELDRKYPNWGYGQIVDYMAKLTVTREAQRRFFKEHGHRDFPEEIQTPKK